MSSRLENVFRKLNGLDGDAPSTFTFKFNGDFVVNNAVLFWTNFSGVPTKNFPTNHTISFNLALPNEVAEKLEKEGWNVKKTSVRVNHISDDEVEEVILSSINVKINPDSGYDIDIRLYTNNDGVRAKKELNTREEIALLDKVDIQSADCVIHPSESKTKPGHYTGYANMLYVIQEPQIVFGGKYDDWEDEKPRPRDGVDLDSKESF